MSQQALLHILHFQLMPLLHQLFEQNSLLSDSAAFKNPCCPGWRIFSQPAVGKGLNINGIKGGIIFSRILVT
jgi:hypothetical protein